MLEFKTKYKSSTATYIKYDISSVKKYKICSVISGAFVALCFVLAYSPVGYFDIDLGLVVIMFFASLYIGIPLFVYFLCHALLGIAYLKKLERYGYEIPRDRGYYENVLERLPKVCDLEQEESREQSVRSPHSKL